MQHVLGLDQGHSQTRAAVCDIDGNILGVGRAFGACHSVHGVGKAMRALSGASEAAVRQAGITVEDIAVVFCGLTGADWPDEYDLLKKNVSMLGLADRADIANDSIVAFRGGTSDHYGAIVVSGTGGNCAIRSPGGEEFIYHFYQDPDLQGGAGLGRRALKAVYRAETRREPPTVLSSRVLEMLEFRTVDELLRADVEDHLDLAHIADLAPMVFDAAYEGDRVASGIVKSFGDGLAELVIAGLERFDMTGLEVDVVLSGNVFKGSSQLIEEVMIASIHLVAPRARLVNARYEPVVGAVLLGLEALGVETGESAYRNIERSSQRLGLIRMRVEYSREDEGGGESLPAC